MKEVNKLLAKLDYHWKPVVAAATEIVNEGLDSFEKDGVLFIGNDISVAPKYFRIIIWPGISDSLIEKYEVLSKLKVPGEYKKILKQVNGLTLYGLSIFGIPRSVLEEPQRTNRSGHQCLDLGTANKYWKIEYNAGDKEYMFASRNYSHTENCGYFVEANGAINCYLKGGKLISSWSDWHSFIESEVQAAIEFEKAQA